MSLVSLYKELAQVFNDQMAIERHARNGLLAAADTAGTRGLGSVRSR